MNEQCKYCIHSDVCAYKEHYEDAVELYEKAKNECTKYPYFVCDIRCIKSIKKAEPYERQTEQEPKTGYWIYQEGYGLYKWKCNKCSVGFKTDFNYCPNCGAKMEEQE